MTNKLLFGAISVAAAASLLGCGTPNQTVSAPTDTGAALSPETAIQGERHVLADGSGMTFQQIEAQLPKQISAADADRLLVTVDPSQIKDDAASTFSVAQGRHRGGIYRGWGGRGMFRGHGGYRGYGGYRFYRYGRYNFPYRYYGGYYRPYFYSSYYRPFLYNYGAYCSPYSYYY